MIEHTNNWDELIKRRAISDLFKIVRDCNNEIEQVTDKYHVILRDAINDLKCNTRYSSEQFMQLESALYQCDLYFTSDKSVSFEEHIGGTPIKEIDTGKTDDSLLRPSLEESSKFQHNEGTLLALTLIDKYTEALKHKVLDSASNDMLDISKENLDEL